jgi:hypothetical protein
MGEFERSNAVFKGRHLHTLRAAVDRIVPPDAQTPGAVDAGAMEYLLGQLNRDLASERAHYEAFLNHLETAAVAAHGEHFASLSPEAQTELLRQAESDETQRHFFRRFVEHVQEGFYISPIAWGMIGWKVRG